MAENMNLLGNSTQRTFENFEAVLGDLCSLPLYLTLNLWCVGGGEGYVGITSQHSIHHRIVGKSIITWPISQPMEDAINGKKKD